ncbi:glycosyltransferase family 4 protein [Rubrivirga sp.]|uniref:glycosyltransferase family 4 protein n=1 Tax=Rubrivirga sp. TaxID=1885344 RepID=UPI003B525EC3
MIPVPPVLYGGIERIIDMLARGLEDRGHRVTLFAHRDSDTAGRLVPYAGERPGHPVDVARNTLSISRLLATRPDVVHSFGRLATLLPLLPTAIPKVMSYQREPTLSQVRRAARLARRGTLAFTGCAEHIAAQMRPVAPSYAVFNGVPLDTYTFRDRVEDDAPLVFLGRVERIKGAHTAIDVAEKSGRRLVIAGNVSDDAYFDAEVRPRLSDRIEYVGPVDDVQKNELLGGALAFLMPIEWEEPFGIVMAEALACGTPVVGTPRGSVPEVVLDGVTGFIRPTVAGLAQAVGQVAGLDRAACRADCEARFSDRAIVDAYEALYRERVQAARS